MSDPLVFYTHPMSRGRIIRWLMEEVGQPYETQVLDFAAMKDPAYLAVNPMGKAMISYPQLTNEKLEELERHAYRSFYLRPKIVANRLSRLRSITDLVNDIRVAKRVLLH